MIIRLNKFLLTISRSTTFSSYFKNRKMSTSQIDVIKSLCYNEYGEPSNVLKIITSDVQQLQDNEVTVKWLLAPVNPADINTIQGKYPSKPPLPAIPGNEGVGEVIAIGPNVKELNVGDRVVPNGVNLGTWRTHANYKFNEVIEISKNVGIVEGSCLNVNPCTAYRMLKDFVPLQAGDTVIQNGGNSAVGQMVIQLCKTWNYKSVNVIRDRPNITELKDQLKKLGADEVFTEAEIRTTELFKNKLLPQPKLALNCICGQNATDVMRHLAHGGVMVTYGSMSREPLAIPASVLIFKDLSFKGFWMTAWTNVNKLSEERKKMIDELIELFEAKKLQSPPHKLIPFTHYQEAIKNALSLDGKQGMKYILDMRK